MKKIFKFILIITFLILFSISSVYAVGIDMDLNINSNNSSLDNVIDNNIDNNVTSNVDTPINSIPNPSSPKVSTTNTSEDFHLSVSDIIDIILISVGIVLILLAISILIKIR